MLSQSNALGLAVALLVAFAMGWLVNGWRYDSVAFAAAQAAEAVAKKGLDREASVSAGLEAQLARLSANKTVIQREKQTIIERPVYSNVCLDSDGLRIINAAKNGAISAKPNGGMP